MVVAMGIPSPCSSSRTRVRGSCHDRHDCCYRRFRRGCWKPLSCCLASSDHHEILAKDDQNCLLHFEGMVQRVLPIFDHPFPEG